MRVAVRCLLLVVLVVLVGCQHRPSAGVAAADVYAFTLDAADGSPYALAQQRGKALLIVNTASECHFAPQMAGLQTLWSRYQDRGLVVIAVPSNDFFGQEPRDGAELIAYCTERWRASFPIMARAHVTGGTAIPLYRWLTKASAKPGRLAWNYTKFLVGRDGRVVDRFGPDVDPLDQRVVSAVEGALAAPAP